MEHRIGQEMETNGALCYIDQEVVIVHLDSK